MFDGEITKDGDFTKEYVDWLLSENKRLRSRCAQYRSQLDVHNKYAQKRAIHDADYLQYEEENR